MRFVPATILVLLGLAPAMQAASPCGIGFLNGPVSTVVDANLDAEWTGAGVSLISTSSAATSGCSEQLGDIGGVPGNINVYSKRYTRSGVQYLGMLFDIDDPSPCTASATCLGERIAILFDPNLSGGTVLQNTAGTTPANHLASDYKIVLSHYWDFTGAARPATVEVFKRSSINCAGVMPWESTPLTLDPATDGTITFRVINRSTIPGTLPGYRAEIEIPLLLLGNPTGDIGAGFAVINDTGAACVTCFDYSSSFPSSIPVNDGDNPIDICGPSWTVPDSWGTGFFTAAPADVTFSHIPDFYFSEDIDAISCGTINNTYHPAGPCRMAITARPRNSGTASQARNLLYLWGEPGIGQTTWTVVELKAVTVTTTAAFIESIEVPSAELASLTGHPCVRVYILPPVFLPNFPSSQIQAITTTAELQAMVAAYGLGSQHSAQQNISGNGAGTCPITGCGLTGSLQDDSIRVPRSLSSAFSFLPQDSVAARPRPIAANTDAPRVGNVGSTVRLAQDEFARLRGSVLVKIAAWASPAALRQSPSGYHFTELLGAQILVFPVAELQQNDALPIVFGLGNPGRVPLEVFLQVDVYVPPGVDRPEIRLRTGPIRLDPNQNTTQTGAVVTGGTGGPITGVGGKLTFAAVFGANVPTGTLSESASTGPSFAWDLEYRVKGPFAIQLLAGQELMCSDSPSIGYLSVTHITGVVRFYIPTPSSVIHPFVSAGGGYYQFHPGSSHGGVHAGGGWLVDLTSRVGFEAAARYHTTDALPSDRANFVTFQGGLRFRF